LDVFGHKRCFILDEGVNPRGCILLGRKSDEEEKSSEAYMLPRKKIQKMANKCLKNLQDMPGALEKDDNYLVPVIKTSR